MSSYVTIWDRRNYWLILLLNLLYIYEFHRRGMNNQIAHTVRRDDRDRTCDHQCENWYSNQLSHTPFLFKEHKEYSPLWNSQIIIDLISIFCPTWVVGTLLNEKTYNITFWKGVYLFGFNSCVLVDSDGRTTNIVRAFCCGATFFLRKLRKESSPAQARY